jgi:hypothetical protein
MKHTIPILCIATAIATLYTTVPTSGALAQDTPAAALATPGWMDNDADGRHDLFCDFEGDGVNDMNRHRYAHRFAWADADGDGLNDAYRDADGDGVNDLETAFRDSDGDGRDDNVLDLDGDGRNDVTGLAYARDELHGERFGFVFDGAGWVDEDGDGFADLRGGPGQGGRGDRFIDSDGDGMADGCWFADGGFQHYRERSGQGGGGYGGGGSGGGGNSDSRWGQGFWGEI